MFLFQGIFLSIWTVGFKKTFTELVPRFPGLFLFPIFGLFTFGPKSHQNCQCPSYGNNEMQVSFPHTYVNLSLWVLGFFGVALFIDPRYLTLTRFHAFLHWIILLVPSFFMFLLLFCFCIFIQSNDYLYRLILPNNLEEAFLFSECYSKMESIHLTLKSFIFVTMSLFYIY